MARSAGNLSFGPGTNAAPAAAAEEGAGLISQAQIAGYLMVQQAQQVVAMLDASSMRNIQAVTQAHREAAQIANMQSADQLGFGAGRVGRFVGEHVFGQASMEEHVTALMHIQAADQQRETFYSQAVSQVSHITSEAISGVALSGQEQGWIGSKVMGKQAEALLVGGRAAINIRQKGEAADLNRRLATAAEEYKAGDISKATYRTRVGDLAAEAAQDITKGQEDVRHVQEQHDQMVQQSKITAVDETIRAAVGVWHQTGQIALQAGAGGEETAFHAAQRAAMIIQKRKEEKGEALPEETAALEEKQKQDRQQRDREVHRSILDEKARAKQAELSVDGDYYKAQKVEFEAAAAKELDANRNLTSKQLEVIKDRQDAERNLMERQHQWKLQQAQQDSSLVVRQIETATGAAELRAQNKLWAAGSLEFHEGWSAKVKAAENALALARSTGLGAETIGLRQAELDATKENRDAAMKQWHAENVRQIAIAQEQVQVTQEQAVGHEYTAAMKDTINKANRAYSDASQNPALQKVIREQEKADLEKEEFQIKLRGLNQPGQAIRHSFEQDMSGRLLGRNPLEDLKGVTDSIDLTVKNIGDWLKQQVAVATP